MTRSLLPAGSAGPDRALRCGAFSWAKCLGAAGGIAAVVAMIPAVFAATKAYVKIDGEIARECTISNLGGSGSSANWALAVDDITKAGTKDFGFTLNCNAPFSYSLEAQNGALTHQSATTATGGFVVRVPYWVTVHIPTDAGTINDTCSGESIRAGTVTCAFSNSGNGIALGTAGLFRLAWAPGGMLMAGKYIERLTITIVSRQ